MSTRRSYRCYYTPKDPNGWLLPAESGVLPFIQVLASDAEDAQRKAHHLTGCPISNVERLEAANPWPFPALSGHQQSQQAATESALRESRLRAFRSFDDTVAGALA